MTTLRRQISNYYRPSSRYQQFTTIVGNYLYMWGGDAYIFPEEHDTPTKIDLISVVEILDLTSGKWEQKRTRGTPPLGIIGYVSTTIESNVIYFGGYCNHDRCYHNSLKILDIDSLVWRDIVPSNPNQAPMKRGYGGIAALKVNQQDYLLIIGGRGPCPKTRQCDAQYYKLQNGMYRTNETHLYDFTTNQWILPTISGKGPPPCSSFTLTAISDSRVVLFGGLLQSDPSNTLYIGQIWKSAVHWEQLSKPINQLVKWPETRRGHAATIIRSHCQQHIIVIGGRDNEDSWLFDIDTKTWTELSLHSNRVSRCRQSLSAWSIDSKCVCLVEFGGLRGNRRLNDTTITELIFDDQWSVRSVLNQKDLGFFESYQRKLRERRIECEKASHRQHITAQLSQDLQVQEPARNHQSCQEMKLETKHQVHQETLESLQQQIQDLEQQIQQLKQEQQHCTCKRKLQKPREQLHEELDGRDTIVHEVESRTQQTVTLTEDQTLYYTLQTTHVQFDFHVRQGITVDVNELSQLIERSINNHYADLHDISQSCMTCLANRLFQAGLINKAIRRSPTFDSIVQEFVSAMRFMNSFSEVQDHCTKFLTVFNRIGGSLAVASRTLQTEWSEIIKCEFLKTNLKWLLLHVIGYVAIHLYHMVTIFRFIGYFE